MLRPKISKGKVPDKIVENLKKKEVEKVIVNKSNEESRNDDIKIEENLPGKNIINCLT